MQHMSEHPKSSSTHSLDKPAKSIRTAHSRTDQRVDASSHSLTSAQHNAVASHGDATIFHAFHEPVSRVKSAFVQTTNTTHNTPDVFLCDAHCEVMLKRGSEIRPKFLLQFRVSVEVLTA